LRPSDPFMSARADSYMSGGLLPAGRYELHRANLANLIQSAYGIQDYELVGGPTWLDTEHYEVIAKTSPKTTPADLKLILKALLAERFQLVAPPAIAINLLPAQFSWPAISTTGITASL
jgi:uncharacterized protein (TIGR03435 family)